MFANSSSNSSIRFSSETSRNKIMVNLTSSTLSIAQAETLVEIPNLAALLTPETDSRISAAEVIKRQPIDPRVSKITPFETTTLAVVNQELETSITISASSAAVYYRRR